ncbi:MAG: hypothetical protein SCK70_16525, partial [bacterium]|nr:hypothetical protein [bacterium]
GDALFINLGMGGEIIYFVDSAEIPIKVKFYLEFIDGSGFFVTLWWFGYFHLVRKNEANPMTDHLGPDALEISTDQFLNLLQKRRGAIKPFLLNQKNIRGIGNFYIQEILFQAKLHPLRQISTLDETDIIELYRAIHQVLNRSIELGSSSYELDFFGNKGDYSLKELSIAYDENGRCPVCGSQPEKIKTGGTSQYICSQCQPLTAGELSDETAAETTTQPQFRQTKIKKSIGKQTI